MKLKGRSILIACLILFGGFAVYDYYQEQRKEGAEMEASRLMTLNYEQVQEIELKRSDVTIHLKRDVDGWSMISPFKDLADNAAAEDLVKSVFTEKIIEVAKEGEIDNTVYGFDQPLGTLTFRTSDGKSESYIVSAKTNFEGNTFLKRNDQARVLVVNSVWETRIRKPAIEFRERHVLRRKIAGVDGLKLKNQGGTLALTRKDGTWIFVPETAQKPDQNEVRSLLTSIADAQAADILESSVKLPSLKTLFTLQLSLGDQTWSADVGQAPDRKIYARVSEPEQVLILEAGALDKLIGLTSKDLLPKPAATPEPASGASTEGELPPGIKVNK